MKKGRYSFRFEECDVEEWEREAKQAGLTLSEWIRRTCNGAIPEGSGGGPGGSGAKAGGVRKGTCEHGVEKGWRCSLCGGIVE